MKRLLMIIGFLAFGSSVWAVGNSNPITVSSGTFKAIDLYDNNSGGARQAIVIGDVTSSTTLTVDSVKGIPVYLSTGTSAVGSVIVSTGGITATQGGSPWTVNVATGGVTATEGGTWTVNVATGGVNVTGTVNQGTAGASDWRVTMATAAVTGTVTSNQGTAGTQDWRVTQATNAVTGTVTSNQGTPGTADWRVTMGTASVTNAGTFAVQAAQSGTWTVQPGNTPNTTDWRVTQATNAVTGTVTSNQGTAGTGDWPVRLSTTSLQTPTTAALQIQGPAGILAGVGYQTNGGSIPVNVLNTVNITGAISATGVNITTAAWDTTIPAQGVIIGGVNSSGLFQSFAVNSSSALNITGTISAASVNITTASYNASYPTIGSAVGYINSSGLFQAPSVNSSSQTLVAQGLPGTQDWRVTMSTNAITGTVNQGGSVWGATVTFNGAQNVILLQPTVLGATVTYNGTQTVSANAGTGNFNTIFPDGQPVTSTSTYVVNITTTTPRVLVSSNTSLPATASDTAYNAIMGDNEGRIVTQAGVPTAVLLSSQPAAITGTGYIVLVASPSSTVFTHMCGCSIFNTSATDTYVTLYPSGNSTTSNFYRIGAPKANFVSGIWPGCDKPFLNTTTGGVQVTVVAAASVSSLYIQCQYYQSTSP